MFPIDMDITDFVGVLNSEEAVRAFSLGGNVTVGGNISASVGPTSTGGAVQASLADDPAHTNVFVLEE